MKFDETAMRARFHELTAKREKILAKSGPLREERDAIVQAAEAQVQPLIAEIKKAEADLYDIDMERAAMVRALKGKVGEPV